MSDKLEFLMVQFNPIVGDISGNTDKILKIIGENNKSNNTRIFVFPELSLCGYTPEDLLFRKDFKSSIVCHIDLIRNSIKSNEYLILGAPSFSEDLKKIWNSAYIFNDKKIIHIYNKQILPNYGVFDEKRYFQSGTKNLVLNINNNKICILICEDSWGFESLFDPSLSNIDFLVSINASPYEKNKDNQRINYFKNLSLKYGFNLIYLNIVGGQDEIVFDGSSFLLDRYGNLLHTCMSFYEDVFSFIFEEKKFSSNASFFLKKEFYEFENIYEAIKLGTFDYISKSGFNGVIIGLSGGIDSALVLALASDIFDKDNIEVVLLPSIYTSDLSMQLAKEQCGLLNIKYSVISIKNIIDAITTNLEERFSGLQTDITEENIQSRARGLILMSLSNKTGKMLLTTGNKSELSVGYSTLYGDMCGSFAPLKDVYKTDIYSICKYRNSLSYIIPQGVIDRMPTAELASDQYDIDSLPQYDTLDAILKLFIEERKSIKEICLLGFEKNLVTNIIKIVIKNEFKRRQYAPGVKITKQSFGKERRFPIESQFKF